ncbi:hypothetical protein [Paenibacillus ginsengarvi]|uniref:hypothetical protein n=1 Tax=Paenibacillus ginsengarvi TaxID=400777 RepID=UPI001315A1B0|nr:hypothetical protein [Paenibacillus ginsengarvi]
MKQNSPFGYFQKESFCLRGERGLSFKKTIFSCIHHNHRSTGYAFQNDDHSDVRVGDGNGARPHKDDNNAGGNDDGTGACNDGGVGNNRKGGKGCKP